MNVYVPLHETNGNTTVYKILQQPVFGGVKRIREKKRLLELRINPLHVLSYSYFLLGGVSHSQFSGGWKRNSGQTGSLSVIFNFITIFLASLAFHSMCVWRGPMAGKA